MTISMTMAEIDKRRERLAKARAIERRFRVANENNEIHPGGRYRRPLDNARLAVVAEEESVLEALREWWAQGCREDEEAGCPCGKVAVKPGEDPLIAWCAAGHPVDDQGRLKLPEKEEDHG